MIEDLNMNELVYNKLTSICKCVAGYPREWNTLPIISYQLESCECAQKCDGEEFTTRFVYLLNLFLPVSANDFEYTKKVDDAMSSLGFTRDQLTYLNEGEGIHIVFRYTVYVNKYFYAHTSL
jgi:hypothetical protein